MNAEPTWIDIGMGRSAPTQRHVLLVDDDAATRQRLVSYLTLNDFRVTPAENGKRMMEILADDPIDLVALELSLRGEDGLQLARRLRETSTIPIIIVTRRAEEADRVMSLELPGVPWPARAHPEPRSIARSLATAQQGVAATTAATRSEDLWPHR
jgi:two-component system OmpR family response regulator